MAQKTVFSEDITKLHKDQVEPTKGTKQCYAGREIILNRYKQV